MYAVAYTSRLAVKTKEVDESVQTSAIDLHVLLCIVPNTAQLDLFRDLFNKSFCIFTSQEWMD